MADSSTSRDAPEREQSKTPTASKIEAWKAACSFILVFGCPALGKGTMCHKLANDPELVHTKLHHLSIGDHLRELPTKGALNSSASQDLAKQTSMSGAVLVDIIKHKVAEEFEKDAATVFILDGFPRNQEQFKQFSDELTYTFAIHIASQYSIAKARYLARRHASRPHDDEEMFEKRYEEFMLNNPSLIQPIEQAGLLVMLEGIGALGVGDTYEMLKRQLKSHLEAKKLFDCCM